MKRIRNTISFAICIFAPLIYAQSDITTVGELPDAVWETSGLIYHNDRLITHNDSGNAAELYELDPVTLQVTRTVSITNATNTDWEDITQDAAFIYIGDFGNNSGSREDLTVYRIAKSDYDISDNVLAEEINFIYEDQLNFEATSESDFDAEALFALGDHLIILTKQGRSLGTVAYKIPKLSGAFLAERLDSYQVDGLVTGATFDSQSATLYLVGYSNLLQPFFATVTNVNETNIFGGDQTKVSLSIGPAQTEAITQTPDNTFYISSEDFSSPPLISSSSRLFTFSLDEEDVEEPDEDIEEQPEEPQELDEVLVVYKSPGDALLNYRLTTDQAIFGSGVFDNVGRLVYFIPPEDITEDPIDISRLSPALYYLVFFFPDSLAYAPFFRD